MLFSLNLSPVKPTLLLGRMYHKIGGVFQDHHLPWSTCLRWSCFYSARCVRTLPRQGRWLVLVLNKENVSFFAGPACISGLAMSFWLLAGRLCLVSIFMTWWSTNFSLCLKGFLILSQLTSKLNWTFSTVRNRLPWYGAENTWLITLVISTLSLYQWL